MLHNHLFSISLTLAQPRTHKLTHRKCWKKVYLFPIVSTVNILMCKMWELRMMHSMHCDPLAIHSISFGSRLPSGIYVLGWCAKIRWKMYFMKCAGETSRWWPIQINASSEKIFRVSDVPQTLGGHWHMHETCCNFFVADSLTHKGRFHSRMSRFFFFQHVHKSVVDCVNI